jgi:hypothetical protein
MEMRKTGSRYGLLHQNQLTSSSATECTIEAVESSISLMETHCSEVNTIAALIEKELSGREIELLHLLAKD